MVLVSHREIESFGWDFFFAQLRSDVLGKLSSGEDVLLVVDEAQVLQDDTRSSEGLLSTGTRDPPVITRDGKLPTHSEGITCVADPSNTASSSSSSATSFPPPVRINPQFEELVLHLFNILPPRAVLCTLTNATLGSLEFSKKLRSRLSRHLVSRASEGCAGNGMMPSTSTSPSTMEPEE